MLRMWLSRQEDGIAPWSGSRTPYTTVNLTPFLLFDGDCGDAMAFYQSCLGGELTITRLGDTPMGKDAPPEHLRKVAYARLKSDFVELSATDWQHPTRVPKPGNTVAIYLQAEDQGELRAVFDKLAVGADEELLDDLREMPFGTYGHLADRFGVHWFFRGDAKESDFGRSR
jgi:PhnB protein